MQRDRESTRPPRRTRVAVSNYLKNVRPPRPFPPRYRYTGLGRFRVPSHHSHTIPAQLITHSQLRHTYTDTARRTPERPLAHRHVIQSHSQTLYASRLLAAPTSNLQPYIAHTSPRHGVACSPASSYTVFLYDITRSFFSSYLLSQTTAYNV